jgi:hypothetical protein
VIHSKSGLLALPTNIRLGWKGLLWDKHSSLLLKSINYDGKSFIVQAQGYCSKKVCSNSPGAVFTIPRFMRNLRMGPISKSVTQYKAGKSCQGQTWDTLAYY